MGRWKTSWERERFVFAIYHFSQRKIFSRSTSSPSSRHCVHLLENFLHHDHDHLLNPQRCKKLQILQIYLCYFFLQLVLIFGPFWVIFGPFRQFWVIFGPIWVILGLFWVLLGHFWAIFCCYFLWQNMHLCYSNRFLQLCIIVNIFVIFIIIVIIVMIIFCSGKAKGSVCWVTVVFSSPSSSLSSSSCCSCTGWSVISSSFQNKHGFCIVLNIYVTFAGLARNISHNVSKFTFCIPTLILQNTFPPPFQHLENLNLVQGF